MKKLNIKSSWTIIGFSLLIICVNKTLAQEAEIKIVDTEEMNTLINSISDSLEYYYVDKEVGRKIGNHLRTKFENEKYDNISSPIQFAEELTKDLRSINGDLHLFLKYHSKAKIQTATNNDKYGVSTNYGFQEIKFIEGNIAFLKITHFSNWNFAGKARQKITEVMDFVKNSNAFIIDLRDNRGGVPYIASFLASYFFEDEYVHLADFYTRFNDYKYGIYTEPLIPGIKHDEKPIYILVNGKSASAAEEFAFWMQNHGRATIIGESTAGAGYGAMNHQLNDRFSISISSEEEIDPITKKGFQGTGVIPDIMVNDSSSYFTAISLAQIAIKKQAFTDSIRLKQFYELLEDETYTFSESEIFEQIILLHQLDLLSYNEIDSLGKKYLEEPKKSIPILRGNTILYSFYPQPFETYAQALTKAKNYRAALEYYNKAVLLATIKNNPSLEQIKLNRDNFINKYENILLNKN